jgi:O-antigen ligase
LNQRSPLFDLRLGFRFVGALVSFEAVLIFFLVSGSYKSDPRFSWLPIDSTLLFFALGVAMGLAIIYREGIYLPGLTVVSLFLVFIAWVLLTGLWTPSELYAREKLLKLATLGLWTLIATAMIIANRPERVRRFLILVLVLGTAAALDGIAQHSGVVQYAPPADAFSVNEAFSSSLRFDAYLGRGRFFGLGALVAFAAWLYTNPFSGRGISLMAAFATCCYGLLITGGRGPTLAVAAAMLLPLALGLRITERRLFASRALVASIALFVASAAVLLQVVVNYSGSLRTVQRFNVLLTEEGGGGSAAARWEHWTGSWHLWLEQPLFGSGVGSWPMRYLGFDVARDPHNLIIEVLVEFGLIGLLLLVTAGVAATRRATVRRLREDPPLMCAAMLCISTFLAAMTSSDITENRNLFAMFGLLSMRPYSRTSHVDTEGRARALRLVHRDGGLRAR